LETLPAATAAFHLDQLARFGSELGMPHTRSLGDGLFELRFDVERVAQRISFFFPGQRRIVLLTVFRKQRNTERQAITPLPERQGQMHR
jgi:phage-related protein